MYSFVNYTWNTLSGRCCHNCSYCYNLGKPFFEGKLRFNEKNLKDNLGKGNFIFVGSSNDLFASSVPEDWILKTLEHCRKFNNKYLFQTKNPGRYFDFLKEFPNKTILGTTLETNKYFNITNAPSTSLRYYEFMNIKKFKKMISIEPILDFHLDIFSFWIKRIKPEFVSIGADSKGHNLPEPSKEKIEDLISELKKFTEVKLKDNLKRLLK